MFLKKYDYLSPSITLYIKGQNRHSSVFSGVLTIFTYIIIFSLGIYYSLDYIYKDNPNIYYYSKYVDDAGIFPLNSSSLFHFIKFANTNDREDSEIDFNSIRIFGFEYTIDTYISNNNLSQYNHWLYGSCNSNDIKNIESYVNEEFPEKSSCIRYYYDAENHKYYNISQKNFKWPALLHGTSNDNTTNYGIVVEKCRNDSLQNNCKSESEIDDYIQHLYIILFFIDNYIEVLNYKTPYIKYLNKLTNGLFSGSFTINNLNFNPSIIKDNDGAFVNFKRYKQSYIYTQNEKTISTNSNNTNIMICFYFWMQNTMIIYERFYESLQDLLSNIGGIESFLSFIASLINSLVVNYIILLDTEELVLNTDKINFKKVNINSKPTILKKASQIFNPPPKSKILQKNSFKKINTINNKQQSSIIQILLKDKSNISKLSNKMNIEAKSEPFSKIYQKNYEVNLNKEKSNKGLNNSLSIKDSMDKYNIKLNTEKNNIDSKSMSLSLSQHIKVSKTKNNKEEGIKPITKQNFTWFNYLFYILTFELKNPKISYYENFRKEVISEENIIQNHINIFKLLRACKIENLDPFSVKNTNKNIC